MSEPRRILPEPFILLLTGAWIVGLFSVATAPIQDLWRPLVVGLVGATVVSLVAAVASRHTAWPSIGAGVAWLALVGAWPLALGVALVAVWRLAVDALRRRQGRRAVSEPPDRQVVRVANALAAGAAIVAGLTILNSGAIRIGAPAVAAGQALDQGGPSIYLVLLDGYPATETLRDDFDYDNGPFEAALAERGFDVADAPSSNYNRTLLTLTSMLHARHVDEINGPDSPRGDLPGQTRQLTAAINTAPVPRILEAAGYTTVAIGSSYGEATLASAERVANGGPMTLFEEQLIRYAAAGRLLFGLNPDLVADQHRASVVGALDELAATPERVEGPAFVLGHVFSPHPPFVFEADGSERPLLTCYPVSCGITTPERVRLGVSAEAYSEGLTAQVEYLNARLLEVVDRIAAADPEAVVVLFSDHGARHEEGPTDEHFRVFLAARTPDHPGLVDQAATLINVLPVILNAYLDAGLPAQDDRRAWAPDDAPLRLEPVP